MFNANSLQLAISQADYTARRKAIREQFNEALDTVPTFGIDFRAYAGALAATPANTRDHLPFPVLVMLLGQYVPEVITEFRKDFPLVIIPGWKEVFAAVNDEDQRVVNRGKKVWGHHIDFNTGIASCMAKAIRLAANAETMASSITGDDTTVPSTIEPSTGVTPMAATATDVQAQAGEFNEIVKEYDNLISNDGHGMTHEHAMENIEALHGKSKTGALKALITMRDKKAGEPAPKHTKKAEATAGAATTHLALDGAFAPAVDRILSGAITGKNDITLQELVDRYNTSGDVINAKTKVIDETVTQLKDAEGKVDALTKKNEGLEKALATSKAMTTSTIFEYPATVSGTGDIPAGKEVLRRASDVFGISDPRLDFDVTCFDWDETNPHVPLIDPDYVFQPDLLAAFLYGNQTNQNIWARGHTGTGKSTFAEQVCAHLKRMAFRVNLDSELGRMDLIGRDVLKATTGATASEFIEGILPIAMQLPATIILDEIDAVRPDVSYVLQRPLEGKGLLLAEDGGRLITPHPGFRIVATANTCGQGDEMGMYPAVRPQSQAMLDRFPIWLVIDYLAPDLEVRLVCSKTKVQRDLAEKMVSFAGEVRRSFINGDCMQTISARTLMAMGNAYLAMGDMTLAMKTSVLNKATDADRATIKGIADRVFV